MCLLRRRMKYYERTLNKASVGAGLLDGPPPKTTVPADTAGIRGRLIAAPTGANGFRLVGRDDSARRY